MISPPLRAPRALSLLLLTLPLAAARAEEGPAVLKKIEQCRAIAEDGARLACFDAAAAALVASVKAKEVVVVDRAALREKKREGFGLPFTDRSVFGAAAGPDAKEITAKITGLQLAGDLFVVTLEDGAVWRTTESSFVPPRLGSKVTIKRGALGRFMMVFTEGPALPARRVR